jgi:hypothetical protein
MLDALAETVLGDITGGTVGDWLVIGWFTPDYRPLAETFAANLFRRCAPFHLWAKPELAPGWNTSRKPSVVLEAMDAYPGKTLVLMDVDCIVQGDMSPAANIAGDVGITILARNMRRKGRWQYWIAAEASSRVVVFRNTEGARAFARRWAERNMQRMPPVHRHRLAAALRRIADIADPPPRAADPPKDGVLRHLRDGDRAG